MKPAQITAEQYIWHQLGRHIVTEPLDDILKQIENQTHINKTHTSHGGLNNTCTGNSMSNTQEESTSNNNRNNIIQANMKRNNGQKDSVNNVPLHKKTLRSIMKKLLTTEPHIEE